MGCEARLACPPSRRRIAQPALTIKCVGANVLAPIALTIKLFVVTRRTCPALHIPLDSQVHIRATNRKSPGAPTLDRSISSCMNTHAISVASASASAFSWLASAHASVKPQRAELKAGRPQPNLALMISKLHFQTPIPTHVPMVDTERQWQLI